ncbi:MAG: flagellar motor switch protein FliN [Proteobacteria bacterium]|nr:flagellar motor switch protein FliN [Pseudomonadota bacterium]
MNDVVNETPQETEVTENPQETVETEATPQDNSTANNSVELEEFSSPEESEMLGAVRNGTSEEAGLEAMYGIPFTVSVVLGETKMPVKQLLKLGRGAVVELDRKVGEAADIYVNGKLIAKGEIVIVEDRLGVTMTEIVKQQSN